MTTKNEPNMTEIIFRGRGMEETMRLNFLQKKKDAATEKKFIHLSLVGGRGECETLVL